MIDLLLMMLCLPMVGMLLRCLCCGGGSDSCSICSDNFDRSDSTDVDTGSACGWDEVAGGWEISSNALRVTSSKTNALCICQATHGGANMIVSAMVSSTNTNDRARLILNYQDSNNFYYAEAILSSSGSIIFGQKVAGTETALQTFSGLSLSAGTSRLFMACIGQGVFTVSINSGGFIFTRAITLATPIGSRLAGVGTGSVANGTIAFNDFTLARSYSEADSTCEACSSDCNCCANNPAAASYAVDIGAPLTDDQCEGCDLIAGEYTMVYEGICAWVYRSGVLCTKDHVICQGSDDTSYTTYFLLRLEMITDTSVSPSKCYWRLKVSLSQTSQTLVTINNDRPCVGWVQYESDPDDATIDCDAASWTLHKTGGHVGSYRSSSSWHTLDEDWNIMCDGIFPDTLTLTRAA